MNIFVEMQPYHQKRTMTYDETILAAKKNAKEKIPVLIDNVILSFNPKPSTYEKKFALSLLFTQKQA